MNNFDLLKQKSNKETATAVDTKMCATALILAGGKSRRFGSDKAMLTDGKQKIVEKLVAEAAKVCNEVLIISDTGQKFQIDGVKEIADILQDAGPMGGLQAGLKAAKNQICLIMACDMPLLNAPIMRLFIEQSPEYEIVLPQNNNDIEPMFGIYQKSLLPKVDGLLQANKRSLLHLIQNSKTLLLPAATWQQVTAGQNVFFNINYQNDYENFLNGTNVQQTQDEHKKFYQEFLKDKKF